MKKLVFSLFFVLLYSGVVFGGEVIRSGDTIVIKPGCLAFNIATLRQALPEGSNTFAQVAAILMASSRALTPKEAALCGGKAEPLKRWRVMPNGVLPDRPLKKVVNGMRVAVRGLRAPVMALCSNSAASYDVKVYANPPRHWRDFTTNNESYVTICVFQ